MFWALIVAAVMYLLVGLGMIAMNDIASSPWCVPRRYTRKMKCTAMFLGPVIMAIIGVHWVYWKATVRLGK